MGHGHGRGHGVPLCSKMVRCVMASQPTPWLRLLSMYRRLFAAYQAVCMHIGLHIRARVLNSKIRARTLPTSTATWREGPVLSLQKRVSGTRRVATTIHDVTKRVRGSITLTARMSQKQTHTHPGARTRTYTGTNTNAQATWCQHCQQTACSTEPQYQYPASTWRHDIRWGILLTRDHSAAT